MQCVGIISNDLDAAIRAMFRVGGEQKRIITADSLAKAAYAAAGLGSAYDAAIADIQCCRLTQNQYTHCNWYDCDWAISSSGLDTVLDFYLIFLVDWRSTIMRYSKTE